jgi:O-antigen ligase
LIFLTFPDFTFHQFFFDYLNISLFSIILLFTIRLLFKEEGKNKEVKIFQYLLMAYALWIILSTVVHYVALSKLDPLTYITVDKLTNNWGLYFLKRISFVYLLYPVLLIATIYLFQSNFNGHRLLNLLPALAIPSLIIGVYQGLVEIKYLNDPYFAGIGQVSGLEIDANGFGISLSLLFPLCVLSILLARSIWKKLVYISLLILIVWCLIMSGVRTGFLGVILFLGIAPWLWIWVDNNLSRRMRYLLILSPLLLVVLVWGMGIFYVQKNSHSSSVLGKRLEATYSSYKKGGVKEIISYSHRLHLGLQAYRLTKLSPLAGWGPGGFYRNLRNIQFRSSDRHSSFDNANNHYLQMSSELGLLGGLFNMLLHAFPLWMVWCIRKRTQNRDERIVTGAVFTTVIIMMLLFLTGPHTTFFSVMWIMVVLQSFLINTALKNGYSFSKFNVKILAGILVFSTAVFLWGTYDNTYGREGYEARQRANWWPYKYEKNCYRAEQWKEGRVRWCKNDAFLQRRLYVDNVKVLKTVKVAFQVHHSDIQTNPVIVSYGGKFGTRHDIIIKDYSWHNIEIPFTEEYIFKFASPLKRQEEYFILSLDVSRTWVPKEWGVNDDPRELGVAVLLNDKYFKRRWWSHTYEKNCFSEEEWGEAKVRWCKKDAVLQIPLITNKMKNMNEFRFAFILQHPDMQLNPVTLSYGGKSGILHKVVINNNAWNIIKIPVSEDYIFEIDTPWNIRERYFVLSLDVSRTWIPKEWGVNDDPRELGVAVLLNGKHLTLEHPGKTDD